MVVELTEGDVVEVRGVGVYAGMFGVVESPDRNTRPNYVKVKLDTGRVVRLPKVILRLERRP